MFFMVLISIADNNPVDTNAITLAGLGPEEGIAFVEETLEKLLLTPGHGFTELQVTLVGKKQALIKTSMANMLDKYVRTISYACLQHANFLPIHRHHFNYAFKQKNLTIQLPLS